MRIGISLVFGTFLLWVAFRSVDWTSYTSPLKLLSNQTCAFACLGVGAMQLARWWRWTVLTSPLGRVTLWEQLQISLAGNALITLLPLRLGEFARPLMLNRVAGIPVAASLASTSVERVLDGLAMCGVFYLSVKALPSNDQVPTWLTTSANLMALIFVSAAVTVLIAMFQRQHITVLLDRFDERYSWFPGNRLQHLWGDVVSALDVLKIPSIAFQTLITTGIFWICNAGVIMLLLNSFGWDLPLAAPWVITSVMVVGSLLPSGPALIGPFQASIYVALSLFQIGTTESAMFGVALYAAIMVTKLGMALPFVPRASEIFSELLQRGIEPRRKSIT